MSANRKVAEPAPQFQLEERRHRGLLLASVTESASRVGGPQQGLPPPLQQALMGLPQLASVCEAATRMQPVTLRVPIQLRKALTRLPRPPLRQHRHLAVQPVRPDFSSAHTEFSKLVTAVGVLAASVSQAAKHLVAKRPVGQRRDSFHDGFRLRWRAESGKRTCKDSEALARALAAKGEELQRALDVRAAVQCFEEVNRLVPGDVKYLALLAKQWSDLTFYHDVATDQERQLVNLKALEYANKAVAQAPDSAFCHVAQGVSKGRLALFVDNRKKVQLAKEVQDAARHAISLDPNCDLAHHLIGRLQYEMAQINPFLRTLVRVMYGTALSPGTHTDALASYQRAQELAPQRLIHRVEAGKVLAALGRREEAARQLQEALSLEVEDINSYLTRVDAEKLLAQWQKRPAPQASLVPPHAHQSCAGCAVPASASLSTAALVAQSEGGMPCGVACA
ncbi:hypothetical protein N2152v2_007746 [Parachlorella kessleri]